MNYPDSFKYCKIKPFTQKEISLLEDGRTNKSLDAKIRKLRICLKKQIRAGETIAKKLFKGNDDLFYDLEGIRRF